MSLFSAVKKNLKRVIFKGAKTLCRTKLGELINDVLVENVMNRTISVRHKSLEIKFSVPNKLSLFRANTFSTKEPETLEWIDDIPEGSIFWDVGANVGLYSIYAAKHKGCRVFAFEPSVFNLELLARNIFLNAVHEQVSITPLALNDKMGFSQMQMNTTEWGGALSSFEKNVGWDGGEFESIFSYRTFGISMDEAFRMMAIPCPAYIKIDVDGIEHFILQGGTEILSRVKEILIEVNDDFERQAVDCQSILQKSGLTLVEKKHGDIIQNSTSGFQNTYNQIWKRLDGSC